MQKNKLLARLWIEFINTKDLAGLCAITSDNWKMHGGLPGIPDSNAGISRLFDSFDPVDHHWKIDDVIAEDDKVVLRVTNYCKQKSYFGIQSHGREQVFSAVFIHRIVDGAIEETWRNADDLGRVLQLGAEIIPGETPLIVSLQ